MKVKITHCTVELTFDIWGDELKVEDVPGVISYAIDHVGYSLSNDPHVVMTRVTEEEME